MVLDTAAETVARFKEIWATERKNLPLAAAVMDAVDEHANKVAIYRGD
jgi:serine/threonine-protein kinase HipA